MTARAFLNAAVMLAFAVPAARADVLWDNGDTNGANGISNVVKGIWGARRTLLDDFVVPQGEHWAMTGFRWRHIWNSGKSRAGRGAELLFREDYQNTPGLFVAGPVDVLVYKETPTGRRWFNRPEMESLIEFRPVVLPPGAYWYEATIVGDENNYWMVRDRDIRRNTLWVNYEDYGGLQQPGWQFRYDTNFAIVGEVVPEPASLSLLAVAGVLLHVVSRRRIRSPSLLVLLAVCLPAASTAFAQRPPVAARETMPPFVPGADDDSRDRFGGGIADLLWDNGDTNGANGVSNTGHYYWPRTVLDDFVVPPGELWHVTGFQWVHIWSTGGERQGRGAEFWIRPDAGNRPGSRIVHARVVSYRESPTGRVWFGRPEMASAIEFDPIRLPPGRYWLEMGILGPENNFWMVRDVDFNGSPIWVDYPDFGGLQPGRNVFGEDYEAAWLLTGEVDACHPCDTESDAEVDATDVEPFPRLLYEDEPPRGAGCAGDTNGDGSVDARDIDAFIGSLFGR